MRLVFISSVTAIRPLRTISVITGSLPRRLLARLLFWRMASACSGDRDQQVSIKVDRQRISRHQHRGGGMLFDQRRPFDLVAGQEAGSTIGRGRAEAARAEIDL